MIRTTNNRVYDGIILGTLIHGSINKTRTFRVRPGNGYLAGDEKDIYQDQYPYFLPTGYATANIGPARQQWIAAVHKWTADLTAAQKAVYDGRANAGLHMSGFNLFMREAMKGLVDMYVDRGDPAAYDVTKAMLDTDGAWHEMDISAIVPAGAKAVHFLVHFDGVGVDWKIMFRKKGNTNEINHAGMETLLNSLERHRSAIVACDSNRTIEYKADNVAWTTLSLAVRGWWT